MVLIELHYLPSSAFFSAVYPHEKIVLETSENYVKQSYRNRCRINSANGPVSLSIPVVGGNSKVLIRDLRIDYNQTWVKDHWRAIQSAYGKAPYFEFYFDYLKDIYDKRSTFLFDLNLEILTLCLKFLQMDHEIRFTESYEKDAKEGIMDLRGAISPKNGNIDYQFHKPVAYPQIFGKDFVANLSVIDMLFSEGPNARTIIQKSVIT